MSQTKFSFIIYVLSLKGVITYENNHQRVIAILLILGVVKTFQDHDIVAETTNYYQQFKEGEILQNIENVNFDSLKISMSMISFLQISFNILKRMHQT